MGVNIIDLMKIPKEWKRENTREWSNLPTDLFQEIMAKLNRADRIRFRYVCKKWLSLPFPGCRQTMENPWLLTYTDNEYHGQCQVFQFNLFDPILIHTKPCTSIRITKEIFLCPSPVSKTLKHGWVFFSTGDKDRTSFILFSPFTGKIVPLPDFHHGLQHERCSSKKITFSSDPASKDCAFFILLVLKNCNVMLGIYKHGDKQWTITKTPSTAIYIKDLVYFEGILYCLFHGDHFPYLLTYGVKASIQKWGYLLEVQPGSSKTKYVEHYLLESNGELLLVCFGRKRSVKCGIFTLDRDLMSWVTKTTLANRALFIGQFNLISVPAIGETKHLENRIFYYDRDDKHCKFYSLTDGKSYNCVASEYECLVNRKGFIVLPNYKSKKNATLRVRRNN